MHPVSKGRQEHRASVALRTTSIKLWRTRSLYLLEFFLLPPPLLLSRRQGLPLRCVASFAAQPDDAQADLGVSPCVSEPSCQEAINSRVPLAEADKQDNLLRRLLRTGRLLLMDFQEIHFQCLVRPAGREADGELRILCARPTLARESLMDLYLTHPDGTHEPGALLPAGTGVTGPLYSFYAVEQENGSPPGRRLRKKHLLEFFVNHKVRWVGPHNVPECFSVSEAA